MHLYFDVCLSQQDFLSPDKINTHQPRIRIFFSIRVNMKKKYTQLFVVLLTVIHQSRLVVLEKGKSTVLKLYVIWHKTTNRDKDGMYTWINTKDLTIKLWGEWIGLLATKRTVALTSKFNLVVLWEHYIICYALSWLIRGSESMWGIRITLSATHSRLHFFLITDDFKFY